MSYQPTSAIDPDHRMAIERLLQQLVTAVEAPGIDDVLGCFHRHCVLMEPRTGRVCEGRGAVRTWLRALAPRLRLHGGIRAELTAVDAHHDDWALARARLTRRHDGTLLAGVTLSLARRRGAWRIAYVVWEAEAVPRAA